MLGHYAVKIFEMFLDFLRCEFRILHDLCKNGERMIFLWTFELKGGIRSLCVEDKRGKVSCCPLHCSRAASLEKIRWQELVLMHAGQCKTLGCLSGTCSQGRVMSLTFDDHARDAKFSTISYMDEGMEQSSKEAG